MVLVTGPTGSGKTTTLYAALQQLNRPDVKIITAEDPVEFNIRGIYDGAKGVEPRTIKLMEVCRLRDTPILTLVNKLDREIRPPVEVLDEIEQILANVKAAAPDDVRLFPFGVGDDVNPCSRTAPSCNGIS